MICDFLYIKGPEVVMTTKTYVDGVLVAESAKCIGPQLDRPAIIIGLTIALIVAHMVIM